MPSATAHSDDNFDCRTCGACCMPEVALPFYVTLVPADLARMTRRWRERNVARESVLTRMDLSGNCVCIALRGTVGRRVSCSIYERRPGECRRLSAGSEECLAARKQAGL